MYNNFSSQVDRIAQDRAFLSKLMDKCMIGLRQIHHAPLATQQRHRVNEGWFYTHTFITHLIDKLDRKDVPRKEFLTMRHYVLPELLQFHIESVADILKQLEGGKQLTTNWLRLWADALKMKQRQSTVNRPTGSLRLNEFA